MSIESRIDTLTAQLQKWPNPVGKQMGVRLVQDLVAQATNPDVTLSALERNLRNWGKFYWSREPKYRKRLDNVVRDMDWMTDPFEAISPEPEAPPEPEPQLSREQQRRWYRQNLQFRADAEMFAAKLDIDPEDREYLLQLAQSLPGEPYRPVRVPESARRRV